MSCPIKRRNKEKKPNPTDSMKKNNTDYTWSLLQQNPNIYCWMPKEQGDKKIVVQDIPEVDYKTKLEQKTKDILDYKVKRLKEQAEQPFNAKEHWVINKVTGQLELKQVDNDVTIVSYDDPKKYDIVKKFIIAKKLKIYGGMGINAYLPTEHKIYDEKDIPDYDVYSYNPWKDAMELAKIFYDSGYRYCEAKAGMHYGTYKVFVNLWAVADFTFLPKNIFDVLETNTINGLPFVHPKKLLESMYKEISEPLANPDRFVKVSTRQKLLLDHVDYLGQVNCDKIFNQPVDPNSAKIIKLALKYFSKEKIIYCGEYAYNTYMNICKSPKKLGLSSLSFLSEQASTHMSGFLKYLLANYSDYDYQVKTTYYAEKELNSTWISLTYNQHTPILIMQINSCSPYKQIGNKYICSIDYLYYQLFEASCLDLDPSVRNYSSCLIQHLRKEQQSYYEQNKISELDDSPLQRFVEKCIGPILNRQKAHVLERLKKRNENVKYVSYQNGYKITKQKQSAIPSECVDKSEQNCNFPCEWNKFQNRCFGNGESGVYDPKMLETRQVNLIRNRN